MMATLKNTTSPSPLIPTQVSVLDFFIPGSTAILAAIEPVLDMNSSVHPVLLCMLLVFLGRHVCRYLWGVAETHFVYDMVGLWMTSQPFAYRKKPLQYSPWKGTFYFIYNKHMFWFRSVEKELGIRIEEVVTVSCFGSPTFLKQFFDDCRDAYLKLTKNKTTLFDHHNGKWRKTNLKSVRPISTVVMNEEDREELLRDIEGYLEPGAPTWHANRGIPQGRILDCDSLFNRVKERQCT
ncbi:hypothetical protein N0V88_000682 [Collariella sp. IMI 366227]|nr:hypothetical protein N0V88_000682 [Collariella sp. IMI 366227]